MKRSGYATMKDVAERAGTTAATVSYILSEAKGRYVSDALRRSVLAAAKELNYIKCSGASSLKGKSRKVVALLVPQFENQFFTRIAVAVEEVFDAQGYVLSICNTFDDVKREKVILNRMQQQRVDGYILAPTRAGAENTEQIRKLGIPLVVVDRPLQGCETYRWVTTSNYCCGRRAAEHLFERGHRRVAFIGWNSDIPDLMERQRAFLEAGLDRGLRGDSLTVYEGPLTAEAGAELTARALSERPDLTALVYGFNIQAKGGVRLLKDRGIEVPGRLSVVLIGSPEWVSAGNNDFTHVDQGDHALGRAAAELLLAVIEGRSEKDDDRIALDCSLVEGSTVRDATQKERKNEEN